MEGKTNKTPLHQWTNEAGMVLIVKCVNRDMTSYKGFVWPKAGPVKPDYFKRDSQCDTGGLFGWPWGMNIGDGKDPDANMIWLVFSAKPENVFDCGGKVKAVPGEDGTLPNVIYCGTMAGAMAFTMKGRMAFVEHNSDGEASATGDSGSASATGYSGSASATGYSGSASATGYSGSASATGDRGSASATGDLGIATVSWNGTKIELGANASGVMNSDDFEWVIHVGAVLIVRWLEEDEKGNKTFPFAFLDSKKLKLKEGATVRVLKGKVTK